MKGIIALCALLASSCASAQTLTVGSKRFTESYVLGEIVSQTANGTHKPGLGNTAILLEALKAGAIDVYPEYTGTIAREILRSEDRLDLAALNAKLKPLGLAASIPLGFSNSYALGMRRKDAERLGIRKVSDLAKHPAQRFGLSHEFLGRRDGWPGLQGAYGLPQKPRGLDHGIAYEALAAGEIDVMDLYTTDAKIERYAIVALEDDRRFFPPYDAVLLYRADTPTRFPKEMQLLEGSGRPNRCRDHGEAERARRDRQGELQRRGAGIPRIKGAGAQGSMGGAVRARLRPPAGRASWPGIRLARHRRPDRHSARHAGGTRAVARAAGTGHRRPAANHPGARLARPPDPGHRDDRRVAGADRALPLRAAADHAQHAYRDHRSAARAGGRRYGARAVARGASWFT